MRRNKVNSHLKENRLQQKIKRTEAKMHAVKLKLHANEENSDYQDLVSLTNTKENIEETIFHPVLHSDIAHHRLKELHNMLSKNRIDTKSKEKVNQSQDFYHAIQSHEIDPELRYRFLTRYNKNNFAMPKINTRLQWQIGESPFFKTQVQFANLKTTPYQNKRQRNRSIKYLSTKNIQTGCYAQLDLPEDRWPNTGTLFITNQRIFFKRTKADSFYIPFENILHYNFYQNAMTVEYLTVSQKKLDAFYLDGEQARLLETMIHITL